ncbi:hypothetical protein OUY22_07185 [Nonomuraea sp. MCN248]|uniref:Uncharacterized protein n=1 Tax=Nonomuraea corallina TaxID=2989783 RepID=A0ABT4S8A2_9ACTN|nr:hypothetical protein [Nonomuraea corallina]MDA0633200.1 hypothetical protein [Nonomuraea corallina]
MAGCLLLTAGCGAERPAEQAASQGPDTPVSSSPVADAVTPAPTTAPTTKPKPVKPTGDAVNPRKVRFTKATPVSKGRQVRLTWWSGVEPCTVLDRVKVKETRKRVTITLYEGPSPKAENVSCIMIAIEKTTTVKLKSPIGKRKIVDGAKS